jgi:hypothetical protein
MYTDNICVGGASDGYGTRTNPGQTNPGQTNPGHDKPWTQQTLDMTIEVRL